MMANIELAPGSADDFSSRASRLGRLGLEIAQSEAQGDDVGGRKWSPLQTLVFSVLVSGSLWVAIGYSIFRLLRRW